MDSEFSKHLHHQTFHLKPITTSGASVQDNGRGGWVFQIPAGEKGRYRLAQLDDYQKRPRHEFPWRPPFHLSLRARASSTQVPGTWGFGLWNNPFTLSILTGVEVLRLPALPNTAWFFFASPPNYLSLQDDLPAQGGLAAVFRSPRWPPAFLALGAPALPLLAVPTTARLLRQLARRFVHQDAALTRHDVTDWHFYSLDWLPGEVQLAVDGEVALHTFVSPHGPLGLVLWIDNQYVAFPPSGRPHMGALANSEPAWIEVEDLAVGGGNL